MISIARLLVAALLVFASSSIGRALPKSPAIDPGDFVGVVDNTYFPLIPGTTFHYEGTSDGVPTSEDLIVTHDTKTILGVTTTVVHDLSYENGVLIEDTFDWYAQDAEGNVWYFGEDTRELDTAGNTVSTEGSWEAGVDGAKAGIIMEADPQVGDQYRQEFLKGVAEDQARVLNVDGSICVDDGCFQDVVVTKETTRLEPATVEKKYYAPGVGVVRELLTKGGQERNDLISVTTGG